MGLAEGSPVPMGAPGTRVGPRGTGQGGKVSREQRGLEKGSRGKPGVCIIDAQSCTPGRR